MVATYDTKTDYKVVGKSPIRHDGLDKVTGRAVYGGDVKVPGLIWGDVIRSPHAHARIKSIDTSAAESMDGVFAVLTHADFPVADEREISAGEDVVNLKRDQANVMAAQYSPNGRTILSASYDLNSNCPAKNSHVLAKLRNKKKNCI